MGNKISSKILASSSIFWKTVLILMVLLVPYMRFLAIPAVGIGVIAAFYIIY